MDKGVRLGQLAVALRVVVIGDDQINAELSCDLGFFDRRDAAVDADDDVGALGRERFDGLGVEAVALFESVGDVGPDVGVRAADGHEGVVEDRRGGDAVDVVVAIDHDLLAGLEWRKYPLAGPIDARQ